MKLSGNSRVPFIHQPETAVPFVPKYALGCWATDATRWGSTVGGIGLSLYAPELHRMISNENPIPPSPKVLEAIMKYGAMSNRYPDQGLVLRGKIAQMNGLDSPECVVLSNGSSEGFDMIYRTFVQPGEETIQSTPCFGIYQLRTEVLGGKIVSVPMIYKNKQMLFDVDGVLKAAFSASCARMSRSDWPETGEATEATSAAMTAFNRDMTQASIVNAAHF